MRLLLLFAVLLSGCRPAPPARTFVSPWRDFEVQVPADWTVRSSEEGDAFRFVSWVGPKDKDFAYGAPRIVAAWYGYGRRFTSGTGDALSFADASAYVKSLEETAWAGARRDVTPPSETSLGGRAARRYEVKALVEAYGLLPGAAPVSQGGPKVMRRDSFVVVPGKAGFYAVSYPGVEPTHAKEAATFERFLATLKFLKDSPVD